MKESKNTQSEITNSQQETENQDFTENTLRFSEESLESDDFILKTAQNAFGITYLYPWQRLVIANILDPVQEKNQNNELNTLQEKPEKIHQIVLLPTGAGKSMCFLVPALVFEGATLILYPLLALMQDQERRMQEGNLSAVTFRGGQTSEERAEKIKAIREGKVKVILANPEVLQSKKLIEELKTCNISHIAIDEAHCVSEWGDTFRPAYLTLGNIIKELEVPRVTAFTATASPEVLQRINQVLFDEQGHIVRSEADRPNIHYYVEYAHCKEKTVLELAEREEKPLLIFCSSRSNAEHMAHLLQEQMRVLHPEEKQSISFYHAGLTKEEKTTIEKWFYPHKTGIMACTCAFGMGVDKKDIKTVIHLDPPQTAESFIQEAGRGGRDGSVAKSILVWSPEDTKKYSKYPKNSRQRVLLDFATTNLCRRQVLLDALGAEQAPCRGCDNCLGISVHHERENLKILKYLQKHKNMYTRQELAKKMSEKEKTLPYGLIETEYEEIIKILQLKEKISKGKNLRNIKPKKIKNKKTTPHTLQFLHFPLN